MAALTIISNSFHCVLLFKICNGSCFVWVFFFLFFPLKGMENEGRNGRPYGGKKANTSRWQIPLVDSASFLIQSSALQFWQRAWSCDSCLQSAPILTPLGWLFGKLGLPIASFCISASLCHSEPNFRISQNRGSAFAFSVQLPQFWSKVSLISPVQPSYRHPEHDKCQDTILWRVLYWPGDLLPPLPGI